MKLGQLISALQSVEGLEIREVLNEQGNYTISLDFCEIIAEAAENTTTTTTCKDYIVS